MKAGSFVLFSIENLEKLITCYFPLFVRLRTENYCGSMPLDVIIYRMLKEVCLISGGGGGGLIIGSVFLFTSKWSDNRVESS